MEKRCEFCKALRGAVYCMSDAAHLCLSCDAKVHSANALSLRHPRTLVCDSCRCLPSLVRCFDHRMFMCQTCDSGLHASLHHRRKVVASYVGCPSAKDLAHLWGLDFKQLILANGNGNESQGGTTIPKAKLVNDESSQKSSYLILVQQILDLERLQLSDSSPVNVKERTQFRHDAMWRDHNSHVEGHLEFQPAGNPEEPLSSPFPQLDSLNGGDSFWQYKSPLQSNEIWLQNMQDLGVCDEEQYFDDVEIPDVDLTFRNFEEVFGIEDDNVACSFAYNHLPSSGKLDRGCCTSTIEETNDVERRNHAYSFSVSRIRGESSASEYKDDDEHSPTHRLPHDSETTDCKENAIARYKEKRVLRQEKQGHYTSPRSKSEFKKRGKSQVM